MRREKVEDDRIRTASRQLLPNNKMIEPSPRRQVIPLSDTVWALLQSDLLAIHEVAHLQLDCQCLVF